MTEEVLSVDELGEFLLSPPPRELPEKITRIALKHCASQTGKPGCIIAIFLLLCVPLFYFMFPVNLISELKLQTGVIATTRSTSVRTTSTNTRINNRLIYRYRFSFSAPSGEEVKGVCYGISSKPSTRVLYLRDDPEIARLIGSKLDILGAWGLLVFLFPAGGALLAFFGWRSRQRVRRLLERGLFAPGKITELTTINSRNNQQHRVCKVTVTFTVNGVENNSSYVANGKNAMTVARRKHENGETVGILYDPSNPASIIVVDVLTLQR